MKDLIMYFGIPLGKRYSAKKKKNFLDIFLNKVQSFGYPVKLSKMKFGNKNCLNAYIGDMKKASTVLVTGYDTPQKKYKPNFKYYPLDKTKSVKEESRNLFFKQLLLMAGILVAFLFIMNASSFAGIYQILAYGITGISAIFVVLLFRGFSNPFNFNKNTASLALLFRLIESLKEQKQQDFAVALLDNVALSFEGYMHLSKEWGGLLAKKTVIILDCIAAGEELFLACTNSAERKAAAFVESTKGVNFHLIQVPNDELELSPLHYFKNCLYIFTGDYEKNDIVVKNIGKRADSEADISRLEAIQKSLEIYVSGNAFEMK